VAVKKCMFLAERDVYDTLFLSAKGAGRRSDNMEGESWMDIRSDRQKGLSYAEIARKHHIDPRTAKKYAESDTRPVYSLTDSKPSKLDPYKEQIVIWLEEAPYSALRIWEKVKEQGFDGCYTTQQ